MSKNTPEKRFLSGLLSCPTVKMARSGQKDLEDFDQWWSSVVIHPQNNLCPRDFMWFNPRLNNLEWLFVLPENLEVTRDYEVFNFPGGLYAVAACKDDEEVRNRNKTSRLIHEWIAQCELFEEDPNLRMAPIPAMIWVT